MNLLHANGHPNPQRYTPGQIMLYCESIWREERADTRARLIEAQIAAQGDKALTTAIRSLSAPLPDA